MTELIWSKKVTWVALGPNKPFRYLDGDPSGCVFVTHPCKCQCMKNVLFANKFVILLQAFPSSLPVWGLNKSLLAIAWQENGAFALKLCWCDSQQGLSCFCENFLSLIRGWPKKAEQASSCSRRAAECWRGGLCKVSNSWQWPEGVWAWRWVGWTLI